MMIDTAYECCSYCDQKDSASLVIPLIYESKRCGELADAVDEHVDMSMAPFARLSNSMLPIVVCRTSMTVVNA